ncbi:IS701 family transposase [Geminocystis sp. NIES-3709]|uniref:IS701 family transposase n=1 Tax=Geminocystis sp. NIES-3709 TaxID=1617448 RepID=UPI0005FCDBF1|nr:IS701 family transposase [Geminocystis sp. NIES-3709]BAQ63381.1 mobile element protein [Geminocystis sp. NIES-3709]BAQ64021.1 mobile element protein [Geminocystis sp. NIES-3709]BAQ64284.1 mobile element protein [Geminocystis sp. NIES-3709]BAQ64347.1 mobile element protein [Geminocystis sp. NIES-3709]BAQ64413.1 mobile element protein [Geminocystis sp. NIES-3709]
MKEITSSSMPPCFNRWCEKIDPVLKTKAQKREFRNYLGGLLGDSQRKNITQIAHNNLDITYHKLHHFLTESTWNYDEVNDKRLEIIASCRQTKISRCFSLIIDDSGHRKSGNFTDCVGRQYIGEIGKTDNGNVIVTTHIYDGVRSFPLDVELYEKAENFPEGKDAPQFQKKPDIAFNLIEKCLNRNYCPQIILMDGGYGNNTNLLGKLEKKNLKYIGIIAKNRLVKLVKQDFIESEKTIAEIAKSLPQDSFEKIRIGKNREKTLWVATINIELSALSGIKTVAIVMNADTFENSTDIDYLMTNEIGEKVCGNWIVETYTQRNWIEVFYREIKGWLGLSQYQVRNKRSLMRHFILVFCAYTFIQWHRLTGGLRRQWGNKPLNTFAEALEAFRNAVSFRFFQWLKDNVEVFSLYKASLGFIWA